MAAEVSSLVRLMNGGDSKEKSTAPMITRDLLGGGCTLDSKELDLDLQVPSGWEKHLDLKSGKVFLQRCNSTNSSSLTTENKAPNTKSWANIQGLNNFTPSPKQMLNRFDDSSLDLKLVLSSASTSPSSSNYQSVCTLDKVKSALERAEKETARKRSVSSMSKSSSSPRSNSSSSVKDSDFDQEVRSQAASCASGCPRCLMYVLVSTSNPKCPRCNSNVPVPMVAKKPRIDLNMSI